MIADLTAGPTIPPKSLYDYFSTRDEKPVQQLVAWRNRLAHFLDVPVSRAQIGDGFHGAIDSYRAGDLRFVHSLTDPVSQTRSLARISTDTTREYVFHVMVEGNVETTTGLHPKRRVMQSTPGILALDLGQPMQMERSTCRLLAFFLPRAFVESVLPEAESIHGDVIGYESPLASMIPGHLTDLYQNLHRMSGSEAHEAMQVCALLIAAAFGKQANLSGSARAAVRAAMFGTIRRYIEANLHEADLSPESVQRSSQLSRPTLYRLFQKEGGLATYIRNCRLRAAADELRRYRHKAVVEIAYGLGFSSASDFNHAFRRAYGMAPLDFRWFALSLPNEPAWAERPRLSA